MDIQTLGNGDDLGTMHEPEGWMVDDPPPEPSMAHVLTEQSGYYIDGKKVSRDEYNASLKLLMETHAAERQEKEFATAEEAFLYAETLSDGIVLDWGRCYVGMERKGLEIGFCIKPYEQPMITRRDLLVQAGPSQILVRKGVRLGIGASSTNFSDSSKSWSEDEVEVLHDGTNTYQKGQRLYVRFSGANRYSSVGSNWRMKLITLDDIVSVLPNDEVSDLPK